MKKKLSFNLRLIQLWTPIEVCILLLITSSVHSGNFFEDVGRAVEKAAQDAGKTVEKTAQDVGKTVEKTAQDVGKTAEKAAQDVDKTAEKAAQDVGKTAEKAAQDVGKTAEKAAQDVGKTAEKAAQDAGKTVEKAVQDTGKTAEKAVQDTGKTAEKAVQDTGAEGRRFARNIGDAAQAVSHFLENHVQGTGKALSNAEERVREGKVVDALWHLGTEPLQSTEDSAAKALQESEYLNAVAQTAASAYGGPGGAAAYAAWYTYKQTGDAELAFRVGLLAGATSKAFNKVGEMPSETTQQLMKKMITAGTIGGIAVAAAGGDEEAIKQGFLKSGGMILIQDGYKRITGGDLDGRASEGDAYCMSTVGAECSPPEAAYIRDEDGNIIYDANKKPQIDMKKVDPRRPHVGKWGGEGHPNWDEERSTFMMGVSRIPGMNAMSVFHDQWAISWHMGAISTPVTIVPAIVLTYVGTGASYYQTLQSSAVKPHSPEIIQGYGEGSVPQIPFSAKMIKRFETQSAISVFDFVLNDNTETLIIDRPDQTNQNCRLVIITDRENPKILAQGQSQSECLMIANKVVAKKISDGYSCFIRDTLPIPSISNTPKSESLPRVFPFFSLKAVGIITIMLFSILLIALGYFGGTRRMQKNEKFR